MLTSMQEWFLKENMVWYSGGLIYITLSDDRSKKVIWFLKGRGTDQRAQKELCAVTKISGTGYLSEVIFLCLGVGIPPKLPLSSCCDITSCQWLGNPALKHPGGLSRPKRRPHFSSCSMAGYRRMPHRRRRSPVRFRASLFDAQTLAVGAAVSHDSCAFPSACEDLPLLGELSCSSVEFYTWKISVKVL